MVLRDISIRNMSFEQMDDVMRPKVLGSIHLDRIFHKEPLEFFVLFSSMNCVLGNPGQANYAAANMFTCALAAQRRKRGLAATALNIGAIIGAGYLEREFTDGKLDRNVTKAGLMPLSEVDFHQLFVEGIEAGHPDSPDGPELCTGLAEIQLSEPDPPKWAGDPKFAHFIVHESENGTEEDKRIDVASILDQLQICKSRNDVAVVVKRKLFSLLACL
jgi:hypothetical protein